MERLYYSKYDEYSANKLKTLERKIHYKLYMLYTKYGYTMPDGARIDCYHTNLNDLAQFMGISRQGFSKYIDITNPTVPDAYRLYRLSQALNIPFEYFMDDSVECMENPSEYCYNSIQKTTANKSLIKQLFKDYGKNEKVIYKSEWTSFLEETGLNEVTLERLTADAKSELTQQIKALVDKTLDKKENLYVPINPITSDLIDDIEENGDYV